ncbi:MAG: F0F1 ATP synthase subunit B [Acidimicrobiales bacterium]
MVAAATNDFLLPNGTFVAELVIFLIVLGVLRLWIVPPVKAAMEQRRRDVQSGLDQGEQGRQLLAEARAEAQGVLDEARREARAMMEKATREAGEQRAELLGQAQARHDATVAAAVAEVEQAAAGVARRLSSEVPDLAAQTAAAVLGAAVDPARHARTVDELVAEMEGRAPSGVAAGGSAGRGS